MELSKILVVFFVIIIGLSLISLLDPKNQTGKFIMAPTDNTSLAFAIVIISFVAIFIIKVPKNYYRPIPVR